MKLFSACYEYHKNCNNYNVINKIDDILIQVIIHKLPQNMNDMKLCQVLLKFIDIVLGI